MNDKEKQIGLLIVDDDEKFLATIAERLGLKDFDVTTATEGKQAIKAAKKGAFDVAILDLKMPGMDGMELLQTLKKKHKFLEVVILTGFASIDSAVEATKLGAFSYLEKPYDFDKLLGVLKDAYEARIRKKYEHDQKRREEIDMLAMGSSPMGILRALKHLDDDEK
jgi:DNA-binding NtrC family response regulator